VVPPVTDTVNVSLARNHIDDKHIVAPYNISSGLFGIRHSYSDNYYATDGEDRGCSARDGNMAFNANQVRCSVHSSS